MRENLYLEVGLLTESPLPLFALRTKLQEEQRVLETLAMQLPLDVLFFFPFVAAPKKVFGFYRLIFNLFVLFYFSQ
jgi:hypothetical protein